jgi:hypothetical protein
MAPASRTRQATSTPCRLSRRVPKDSGPGKGRDTLRSKDTRSCPLLRPEQVDLASQRIRDKPVVRHPAECRPVKTWAGYGTGRQCDGCEVTIGPQEAEYEAELEDGRTLYFHAVCATLWQVLRTALPDKG